MSTTTFVEAPRLADGYAGYDALPKFNFSPMVLRAADASLSARAAARKKSAANFSGGTLEVTDIFETWRLWNGTVAEYDHNDLGQQFNMLLEAANHNTAEQIQMFADITTERFFLHGAVATANMIQMDAGGIPEAEKAVAFGGEQGYALRRFGVGLQWTQEFWQGKNMAAFASTMAAIFKADSDLIAKRLRKALFTPTNGYFYDFLGDKLKIPVRALLNADSGSVGGVWAIPPSPYNSTTFSNTAHTHYMTCGTGNGDSIATDTTNYYQWGSGSCTAYMRSVALNQMLTNLREHNNTLNPVILVNPTDASTYFSIDGAAKTDLTGVYGFVKLQRSTIVDQRTVQIADRSLGVLNPNDIYSGTLGAYDDVLIVKKVWVPQGYMVAIYPDGEKPLVCRVPDGKRPGNTTSGSYSLGGGDLRGVFRYTTYPVYSEAFIRDFEFSCSENRMAAVVLQITGTGSNASYSVPSGL